jgi:hypothetical protein
MFNLIETQQALKGLPLPDVLKYANGNNPTVPSYLALSELQRRKQIEDTSAAFYGQPPTVKEQIESGLTALPQGQVNPTQAPQGVNPTAMPPQLAPSPNMPPPMVNPTAAPAGMQPNAAPPRMMAEGGLSNLPLPHMFRQTSYADGGIVYFGDPAKNPNEEQLTQAEIDEAKKPYVGYRLPPRVAGQPPKEYKESNFFSNLANRVGEFLVPSTYAVDKPRMTMGENLGATDASLGAAGVAEVANKEKVKPTAVPANPNKQASNTSSALITPPATAKPPAMAEFKSKFDAGDMSTVQSPEDIYKQQQKIRALTGVSEDPLAQARERTAKLEAKYAKDSEDDARDGLMSILRGYAKAGSEKPERGFGYAAASGSESAAKFDKEIKELRNNQMKEITTIKNLQDKEDDARKRGDAKGIEEAISAQKKAKMDLYKLQNEEQAAGAAWQNAQTNLAELPIRQQQANAAMMNAQRGHAPNAIQSLEALYKTNPDLAKMYLGQGKVGTMTLEEAYKAVATDPRNIGLTDAQKQQKATELHRWAAGQNAPKTMTMADVKTTAKNSGKSEQEVMDMAKKNGYTIQ